MTQEKSTKNTITKKILNIVLDVVLAIFFILCLLALILTITSKKSADGAMSFFGKQVRIVVSPSMEANDAVDVSQYKIKSIPVKSAVFIQLVPEDQDKAQQWYSQLKVGDVLTFKYVYSTDYIITHRIVDIYENANGGYTITLQGDNRDTDDGVAKQIIDTSVSTEASLNYVIGKVTGTSYGLGVIITGLKQPVGIVLLIIVPCAIIIVAEIIKVIGIFHSDKMEKAATAEQQKVDEIEELKKQIALLQNKQGPPSPPTDQSQEAEQSVPNSDSSDNA